METDNPKNLQAFNWFEKDGHVERRCNHFRLIDLTRENLYFVGVPATLDEDDEF